MQRQIAEQALINNEGHLQTTNLISYKNPNADLMIVLVEKVTEEYHRCLFIGRLLQSFTLTFVYLVQHMCIVEAISTMCKQMHSTST